jgi:low molecular weight protein-tyrosine phosphatase
VSAAQPVRLPVPIRVLFVCMGNICRSPTAEGVMRSLVAQAGLQESIELDSAGTGSWHVGSPPDARASATARTRGVSLEGSARQVRRADFDDFDLLIAMDAANVRELRGLANGDEQRAKVRLLREFDAASAATGELDVPDPYYGAGDGFAEVFDLVQAACVGLLERIEAGELQ